uniref:Putative ovule protein n=1 Tax=Solanum chacoense TaxID=4108 RepID=A0A0V0GYF3_SOLCH
MSNSVIEKCCAKYWKSSLFFSFKQGNLFNPSSEAQYLRRCPSTTAWSFFSSLLPNPGLGPPLRFPPR